jgi:hypothetical protein
MVTLRAFFSPAEAALAKTLLDDHGIVSALADENSYLYGGAPFAMPVRLMVAEDQLEEAIRVLKDPPDGRGTVLLSAAKAAVVSASDGPDAEMRRQPNKPWEFLALALLVAIPGILLLLQKHDLLIVAPVRRRWVTTTMPVTNVHILGALVLGAALYLAWLFFYVRSAINRDQASMTERATRGQP